MKKTLVILLFFYCISLPSCHLQGKKELSQSNNHYYSILLMFYPTGVEEDVRYSISVVNDSLNVKKFFSRDNNGTSEYIAQLSYNQTKRLERLVSDIKTKYQNTDVIVDTWGVTLIINDQVVYETNDFSFELPPNEIKDVINYLVSLSKIKIELDGFS